MTRWLGCCALVAQLALGAAPAHGAHWPVTGGDGSRSGTQRFDVTVPPVAPLWSTPDVGVRTSIAITGGGGPGLQRVAYGTSDGRLHLQVLETGAPVGPQEGSDINDGAAPAGATFFGSGIGAIGLADTSTEGRLGQLFVVHNDDAFVPGVHLTQFDLAGGDRVRSPDAPIADSAGCEANSGLLLTPPAGDGSRILYLTMQCPLYRYLVRVPLEGDATSRDVVIGDPGFTTVTNLTGYASPALVVLHDATGLASYYVAVPRQNGVDLYSAEDPLFPDTNAAVPPAMSVAIEPGEVAVGVAAAATDTDEVAGGDDTGTGPAPALYVTAQTADGGATRVYRFVQDAPGRLTPQAATDAIPYSGAPAPGFAVAETVSSIGARPGGVLVVTSTQNVTLLRAADLGVIAQLSPGQALAPGVGFSRSIPVVSGGHIYVQRDGDDDSVPEHLVLSLADLTPVSGFTSATNTRPGASYGQPALSRGHVVFGSAGGAFAYGTGDGAAPLVSLVSTTAGDVLSGTAQVAAHVADARGAVRVDFRLISASGTRVIARVGAPASGSRYSGRYVATFPTAAAGGGDYLLEAAAFDAAGNEGVSARRRVRLSGGGSLPAGACLREVLGTLKPDRLLGTAAGERMLGGPGDDRLDGAGGHDCVLGEAGDDVLAGGTGDDLLDGAAGDDTMAGGLGRNTYAGGGGRDVVRGAGGVDRIDAGAGSDTVLGGAGRDRIAGGAGNDFLRGERGGDRLITGGGRNRVVAGAGNDRVSAVNGKRDRIDCGPGRDRAVADRYDRVVRCERVARRLARR